MKLKNQIISVVWVSAVLRSGLVASGAPVGTGFTYQGQLKQGGVPVNGAAAMSFSLWDASVAGNRIGVEITHNSVEIVNGLFSVELDFWAGAFDGSERWLSITVNGTPLLPRQRVSPTPYANYAARPWESDATNVFYMGGNVGVGTSTPSAPLEVKNPSQANNANAIVGELTSTWTGHLSAGVRGINRSTSTDIFSVGVYGSHDGSGAGVCGITPSGWGVYGWASGYSGFTYGVEGRSESESGFGVYGQAAAQSGPTIGVVGRSASTSGTGVYGYALGSSGTTYGVHGKTNSPAWYAGYFEGRGYFSDPVGLGTEDPDGKLHIIGGPFWTDNGWRKSLTLNTGGAIELGRGGYIKYGLGVTQDKLYLFGTTTDGGAGTGAAEYFLVASPNGNIGIGTTTPAQKLTVGGTVESLSGGFQFPDGTIQTTAGAQADHGHYGASWTGSATKGLYVETSSAGSGAAAIHARQGADTPTEPAYGAALWGESDQSFGVFGNTASSIDHVAGVIGFASRALGDNNISYGVKGQSTSTSGEGLYGFASSATGATRGIHGKVQSPDGYAGYFEGRGYFSSSLGLGTTTPDGQLHVSGGPNWTDNSWRKSLTLDAAGAIELGKGSATKFGLGVTGNTLYFFHTTTDGGAGSGPANYFMAANSAGNVAIGTTDSQGFKLAVNGTAAKTGGGSWSTLSDRRLKNNIQPLTGALSRLLSLRGVTFEFTAEGLETGLAQPGPQIGLIAQEVERVFPEWVSETPNGHKFVTERGTTGLVVEALRELRAEKDSQIAELRAEKEAEIAALKDWIAKLERQVAELLKRGKP